ncbi:MAG: UDP-N-acetylmuramoyl-L-alanyl-D-glutamate--2,6-diaminopimelate ligase [Christensenellaceae bacterium]
MKLYELFHGMKCVIKGDDNIEISDLKYDSREVKRGDLFFCISGFSEDGHVYAKDAIKKGAAAIVVTEFQEDIAETQIVVKNDRETMAMCACRFFGFPAKRMKTIGITGTNGKTSTSYMIREIASQAGYKVGLVGTITNMIGDKKLHTERTTPESIDLQRLLKQMADEGCDLLIMEVSSHSLMLERVHGMRFDIGVFTNLTQDHLDFHQTWDNYILAKSKLFEQSKISIINIDDDSAANMMAAAMSEVVKYSVMQPINYAAKNINITQEQTHFTVETPTRTLNIEVNIPGIFTVYNAMASIVATYCMGIDPFYIEKGLKELNGVPGRFEMLDTRGKDFSIILDYAHTPDGMKNVLSTIKGFAPARIVTIFGCGGNRDTTKRKLMGKIAIDYSDLTIVTSDNPRFEEPSAIIDEIVEGIKDSNAQYICIEKREEAIEYAIRNAQKNDVILLAGKGHEDYQEIKGVKHDFDEKVVVQNILDKLRIPKQK